MKDAAEITTAVHAFKTNTAFLHKRKRWETDFDLWRLAPYDAGDGYVSYTTNSPKVLAKKVIGLLSGARLSIRIPDDVLDKVTAKTANNVERFLYGALNLNDERLLATMNGSKLIDQLAWYAVVRGAIVVRVYVYKNDEGETVAEVQPWDIYNTAYGLKKDGLDWAANTYLVSNEYALREYKITGNMSGLYTDKTECIDFWDSEKYGLIIGGKWVEGPTPHECKRPPVHIIPAGPMPDVVQQNYAFTSDYTGESIFDTNRGVFPFISKTISDYATIVRRGVKPPIGVWSDDGDATIDEDIYQTRKGAVVHFKTGENVKELLPATAPPDAAVLLNWASGEAQRGGLSHVSFGEVSTRLSGYAINQLTNSMETVITPFVDCIRYAYEMTCRDLLKQFTTKTGLKPIAVRGRTSKDQPFGYPTSQNIASEDVQGDWHPEVKLLPVLPTDDAQKFQLAKLAREGETPLLADKTIRSEMLGVQDPELEDQKIELQFASKLPVIRLWKAYVHAVDELKDEDIANNILIELQRLLAAQGGPPRGNPGTTGGPTATEIASMGTPGSGVPAGSTGVPASTSPPEGQGGMPPGAMNARMPTEAATEA